MSMNLAELGRVLCKEFDQRERELKTFHSEIRTKVLNDRKELVKLREADRVNQQKARTQIWEENSGLLNKYGSERKTMEQGLRADRVAQINEMKAIANEWEEELQGWHKAGEYMVRKRTGR
ncbi:conserved hypothetical protein [Candidatus Desulfosporosinus infrequens]|uniref:Uncharacterized protein n=1 Tax=Candidatus Desulfosporosinus infrequens TaxID=2043169 RepID=A0A2U3KY06_9FIRM|nr:conserved hypothetical protein [Candidatus Desulfosporosinus infrequens]